MGISMAGAEFLVQCRCEGVNFQTTLTLGRQNLCVSPYQLERLLKRHGCWPEGLQRRDFLETLTANPYYADPLLRVLGAARVSSLDASSYEGADIVHDLNRPLPQSLHGSFDVVLDGGLLEHVFNFPTALKNAMEMVKVGGHLLLITPANNNFGHGFYQFSPELFFRALSAENGFAIERMLAIENDAEFARLLGVRYVSELKGRWYEVTDAAQLGERVTLINRRPVMLFIRARRTECVPVFAEYPQQCDWIAAWGANPQQAPGATDRLLPAATGLGRALDRPARLHLKFHLLAAIARRINPFHSSRVYRARTFRNRAFFRELVGRRTGQLTNRA